jgi:hypothetical protein
VQRLAVLALCALYSVCCSVNTLCVCMCESPTSVDYLLIVLEVCWTVVYRCIILWCAQTWKDRAARVRGDLSVM